MDVRQDGLIVHYLITKGKAATAGKIGSGLRMEPETNGSVKGEVWTRLGAGRDLERVPSVGAMCPVFGGGRPPAAGAPLRDGRAGDRTRKDHGSRYRDAAAGSSPRNVTRYRWFRGVSVSACAPRGQICGPVNARDCARW